MNSRQYEITVNGKTNELIMFSIASVAFQGLDTDLVSLGILHTKCLVWSGCTMLYSPCNIVHLSVCLILQEICQPSLSERCSIELKWGEYGIHCKISIPLFYRKLIMTLAAWGLALSCWNRVTSGCAL